MPITYDKRRKKYVARLTHQGTRYYVGQYDDFMGAQTALAVKFKMLERLNGLDSLHAYKIDLEETEQGPSWGKRLGNWFNRRKQSKKS